MDIETPLERWAQLRGERNNTEQYGFGRSYIVIPATRDRRWRCTSKYVFNGFYIVASILSRYEIPSFTAFGRSIRPFILVAPSEIYMNIPPMKRYPSSGNNNDRAPLTAKVPYKHAQFDQTSDLHQCSGMGRVAL